MKKFLGLMFLFFVFASAGFAAHPLIGKWRFSEVVGGRRFYDYITIDKVDIKTKKVSGFLTGIDPATPRKVAGYYNGDVVFIEDVGADYWLDGYYFTFQGTTPFRKHLGMKRSFDDPFYFVSSWHTLLVTKLSGSITSPITMTTYEVLCQDSLKAQAQLRENMTNQTLLK